MQSSYRPWPARARLWMGGVLFSLLAAILTTGAAFAQGGDGPQPPPSWVQTPASPAAGAESELFHLIFYLAVAVFILVEALLIISVVRFSRRPSDGSEPPQIYGNTRLELAWTIMPALVLVVILVFTLSTLRTVTTIPQEGDSIEVDVIGHQWFWEFQYPEAGAFSATGVLTVPVETTVRLNLTSRDVIHSFWVPELAGKTDANPNLINHAWFKADKPGTYRGQCAEFCGLQHSNMYLKVVALPKADYDQWFAAVKQQTQQAGGQPTPEGGAAQGQALFQKGQPPAPPCSTCHSLVPDQRIVGPSLAGVATRAETREQGKSARDYLHESIVTPGAFVVPGFPNAMYPNFGKDYSDEQINELVDYLLTLK